MPYKRIWDDSCPRVWDRWEADNTTWIIQDLPPEDEEAALDILINHLCPDATLFALNKINDDPESLREMKKIWKFLFMQRLTLACYAESCGERKLVGLNVCLMKDRADDPPHYEISGVSLQRLYQTMKYLETRVWNEEMEYMGLDKVISGLGLVVRKEYRGAKLGGKILTARESLGRFVGVKGTTTLFSGPASQTLAARCGFTLIKAITVRELAEAGLNYPKDNNTVIKLMGKMYD